MSYKLKSYSAGIHCTTSFDMVSTGSASKQVQKPSYSVDHEDENQATCISLEVKYCLALPFKVFKLNGFSTALTFLLSFYPFEYSFSLRVIS